MIDVYKRQADTGVTATTDTANQTTETTTIGKNQISIKDFASQEQKVTGKDVLKNAGIKNTAAATTNEIDVYKRQGYYNENGKICKAYDGTF